MDSHMTSDTTLCFLRNRGRFTKVGVSKPHTVPGGPMLGLPHSPWHLAKYLLYSLQKACSSPCLLARGGGGPNCPLGLNGWWLKNPAKLPETTKFHRYWYIHIFDVSPLIFVHVLVAKHHWYCWLVDWIPTIPPIFLLIKIHVFMSSNLRCVPISVAMPPTQKKKLAHCRCQCKLERHIPWKSHDFCSSAFWKKC